MVRHTMPGQEVAWWGKHLSSKHKDEFDLQSPQKKHRHGSPWLPSSGDAPGAKGGGERQVDL